MGEPASTTQDVGKGIGTSIKEQNEYDDKLMCKLPTAKLTCKAQTPWALEQEHRVCKETKCPPDPVAAEAPVAPTIPAEIDPPAPTIVYFEFLINTVTLSGGTCR